MNLRLKKANAEERKSIEAWFKKFDKGFTPSQIANIVKEKRKNENKGTILKLNLELKSVSLLIRENDIIDSLKNLQNHVHFFKSTLGNEEHLQKKVIEHIKKNFIKTLSNDVNQVHKTNSPNEQADDLKNKMNGNHVSSATLNDYLNYITNLSSSTENMHKFLLCLSLDGLKVECRMNGTDVSANVVVSKILGMDLLAVNKQIKYFLEIQSEIKMYYSSRFIKLMNLRGLDDASSSNLFNLVHLNVEIPKINLFIHKPFVERLNSLTEFLAFNNDSEKWKTTFNVEKNSLLYDTILKKKSQITNQMNLSVTINKINMYFPTDYVKTSNMAVLHFDQFKLYKREHENNNEKNVVAITDTKTENEFFSQDFQPLIITIQNIRALIVNDFQWEIIENPFKTGPIPELPTKSYISTLFEILHIHVSIEKLTQIRELQNKKTVFPSQKSITVKLPLLILNLSSKNLYILMNLVQLWTGQTEQIKLNQIKRSVENDSDDSNMERPSNKDDENQKERPTIKKQPHGKLEKNKDTPLAKTKIIDHKIVYELDIRDIIENLVLSQVDVICEGIVVNINLEDEKLYDSETKRYHQHSLLTIYLHMISFRILTKYFESRYSISIKKFIIEDHEGCPERHIGHRAKAIYEELLLEDEEKIENILEEELPDIPPPLRSQSKSKSNNKKEITMCEKCSGLKSRMMLNFLGPFEQPDLLIHVSIIDEELFQIVNADFIQTEINIFLTDMTLLVNPLTFIRLRKVFDYAQLYADKRYKKFVEFMKKEAFWPAVNIEDQVVTGSENEEQKTVREDKGIPVSKLTVKLPSLNVILMHKNNPIYLVYLNEVSVISNTFLRDSELKVNSRYLTLYNISPIAGPHNQILSTLEETEVDALAIHMKTYSPYEALVKNYGKWLGIKLTGVKVVFLKRMVNEFVEYLNNVLLKSFSTQIKELEVQEPEGPKPRSDMKLELAILSSFIEVFRNSLAEESLIFSFHKIGLWSCGKWGDYAGNLIEKEMFEGEAGDFEEAENTERFEDARSGKEEFLDGFTSEDFFSKNSSPPKKQKQQVGLEDDIYKLKIIGLEVKTDTLNPEALFIRFADESLTLDIIFEDKQFVVENPSQTLLPMKLVVNIPSLKMFAYEPDFNLLMKFFQENLGEAPQTVVSEAPPDPLWDKTIWLVVDLKAQEGIIKLFNGTREELSSKYKREAFESENYWERFIYRNPSSLGLLTLEAIHFKMMMRKNGGKVMVLNMKQLDIYDTRHKSKIAKEFKKILCKVVDQNLDLDAETTSYLEFDRFPQDEFKDLNNDLRRYAKESEKYKEELVDPEKNVDPNKKKEIEIVVPESPEAKNKRPSPKGKDKEALNSPLTGELLESQKEKTKGQENKISRFFKKLTECCRRRKKNGSKNKKDEFGESPERMQSPSGLSSPELRKGILEGRKNDSILFNPLEDPNAFVIDKDREFREFLAPSDAPILDLIGNIKDSPSDVSRALSSSRGTKEDLRERYNQSMQTKSQDFPRVEETKFIINDESEIMKPKLKDINYSDWQAKSELFLYFEADPSGEKNIHISLNNKTIIVVKDLLIGLINFFKNPFTDCPNPPYIKQMKFNNYPPMRLKITVLSLSLVLLSKFDTIEDNNALVLMTNVIYNQEFRGDSGFGPGSAGMGIEALLKKLFFINIKDLFAKVSLSNMKNNEDYISNFSLIETFKIYFSTFYNVPYYLEHRKTPAYYDLRVELRNHKKLMNNFVFSPEQLKLIQMIVDNVMQSTVSYKEEVAFAKSDVPNLFPQPEVISTYTVKISKLKLNLIKTAQGMELLHIELSKIMLKALQEKQKTVMKANITVGIEYFNRRKISFEPLVEPWEFMIKYEANEKECMFEISNVDPPFDAAVDLRDSYLNKNALNINVSSAAIETIFELVQRLTSKMKEDEPYKIKNYTGYEIALWNSRANAAQEEKVVTVKNNGEAKLKWKFFRQTKKKSRYVSEATTKSFLDIKIKQKIFKLSLDSERETVEDNNSDSDSDQYRTIRQIDCDLMGKRFYKIRNKEAGLTSPQTKKISRPFDFFNSKKITDQTAAYLISHVNLDPRTGAKEIILRSTAYLKNNLVVPISIRFVFKNRHTMIDDVRYETIEAGGKCNFPIETIEEKTTISFGADTFAYSEGIDLQEILQKAGSGRRGNEDESPTEDDNNSTDKTKKNRKDLFINCKGETESFNFALSVVKKRVLAAQLSQIAPDEDKYCYETVFIADPIISITNATVRNIKPIFSQEGVESVTVVPGATRQYTELPYNDNLFMTFNLANYAQPASKKVFKKSEKEKFYIKFKSGDKALKTKCVVYLWIEITRKSTYSRDIVIYCPYLIINDTCEALKYQEKTLKSSKPSEDPTLLQQNRKTKTLKTQVFKSELIPPKLDYRVNDNMVKKHDIVEGQEDFYEKIHMFSTSKKMNKLQISLRGGQKWSKPFSLQSAGGSIYIVESTKESKERKKNVGLKLLGKMNRTWDNVAKYLHKRPRNEPFRRKKYEFAVKSETAPGIFHRSKLIILTPRFSIKNESGYPIMITQAGLEVSDEATIKIKQNCWSFFHWSDHKKPPHVVMSLCDAQMNKPHGWSGRFKIHEVGEFTVKMKQDKKENTRVRGAEDMYFARVVVTIDANDIIIRILPEDNKNPPYRICNFTPYDIFYKQKSATLTKNQKKNQGTDNPGTLYCLPAGKKIPFAWDELTGPKILEISIESIPKEYNLDTIKDYDPIQINKDSGGLGEKNDRSTLKKGYLGRKKVFDDKYEEEYCVLSVPKQRLKLYNKKHPNLKEKITLKGARIEDVKDGRFVFSAGPTEKTRTIMEFQAQSEEEALEWVDFIKRASFIHTQNLIHVKIDPINSTKVITFQMSKEDKREDNDDWLKTDDKGKNRYTSETYKLSIKNVIGISLIDNHPREIIHITITNLMAIQTKLNETIGTGENSASHIDDLHGVGGGQWERENVMLTIDSFVVNNQLLDAQFPVILAPNKKKKENHPCFFVTYSSKNIKQSNSTLNYILQFKNFVDTLEIRLDDSLISALFSMYSEIPFIENSEADRQSHKIYDSKPIELKLDNKISENVVDNKRIYIKYLRLDPLDIWFTFRNSPGQKFDQNASNLLTDFGLSLVTLDSAKIKLNSFVASHIFGSTSQVVGRISKHYSSQFWTQLYKLFGSIEILGNPVSLIENLGIGVVELFYEPIHALIGGNANNPLKFGQSLAYGVSSFVSHSVTGVSETINKIIRSIAGGLATVTSDKAYLQQRQIQRNRRIRSIKEGLVFGMKNSLHTIWDAATGIFTKPCIETKRKGFFFGFFIGIYIGLVSIVIKPLVGLYDLIITLIQGIKNSANYEEHIMDTRTRPPRLFGENDLIIKYDWNAATAKDVIRRLKSKKKIDHEEILFYDEVTISKSKKKSQYQVVLTDLRFLYVKKYNNLEYTKIKLYKIKSVNYIKEKNQIEFLLLVPIQNNKFKFALHYQSYEKAKPLLKEFAKLKLADVSDFEEQDNKLTEILNKEKKKLD